MVPPRMDHTPTVHSLPLAHVKGSPEGVSSREVRAMTLSATQDKGPVPFGAEPLSDSAMVALHAHGGRCTCTGLP